MRKIRKYSENPVRDIIPQKMSLLSFTFPTTPKIREIFFCIISSNSSGEEARTLKVSLLNESMWAEYIIALRNLVAEFPEQWRYFENRALYSKGETPGITFHYQQYLSDLS